MTLRVLELYCGIGGMHFALERLGRPYEVVAAMEINAAVLETYNSNFPDTPTFNRNIVSLSAQEINELHIDMILLSPPCQPFCRAGLQKDTGDARTDSLCHLLKILPQVEFQYILLENVKGFETSEARGQLLQCLRSCGFVWQEFLLTPSEVGIPNSRLRYYLIGKRAGLDWCFQHSENILSSVPQWTCVDGRPYEHIVSCEKRIWEERRAKNIPTELETELANCVGDILESCSNEEKVSKYAFSEALLEKYYQVIDIVNSRSTNTCCFTKSYGTFVKGTGSIFEDDSCVKEEGSTKRKLRFFTPREVARLMCFPDTFRFPPHVSVKQQYKGLGNSLNVYVVSILLSLLTAENSTGSVK